jgi:hypothetical protein
MRERGKQILLFSFILNSIGLLTGLAMSPGCMQQKLLIQTEVATKGNQKMNVNQLNLLCSQPRPLWPCLSSLFLHLMGLPLQA